MTLRTTIISTSRRVDFEIPAEMVGKELEITAIEKRGKNSKSLNNQYKLAAIENKELVKEFQAIDLEGWENEY
jgi:Ser-tRNA(Ala) deacylase AlaX